MFELTPFSRSLTPFNPFRDMADLERRFFSGNATSVFATDIQDTGDAFILKADLPGVKKEDLAIDIDGDRLSICAQRNTSTEEKDDKGNFIRCERFSGSFSRSFDISNIQANGITAAYEDGVLTLTMPKKEAVVPTSRRLEIQ